LEHLLGLLLGLFELCLAHAKFPINPCNLTLLLVQDALELELQLLLGVASVLEERDLELLFLLLELLNTLVEHLDVQFQLLLDFDMVSHFCFVLLELLLVLFWRQVDRLESRRKTSLVKISDTASVGVEVAVSELVEAMVGCSFTLLLVIALILNLHEYFD